MGRVSDRGRGTVRLFNVDDNSTVYLAFGDTEPGAAESGFHYPSAANFQKTFTSRRPAVWAWANKTGTKLQAVVVGWS